MKKLIASLIIVTGVASCQKKVEKPLQDSNVMLEEPTVKVVDTAAAAGGANAEGLALIKGADCLGCHKDDAKLVGPSYQEIAAKYTEADIDKLADKIIAGGAGNWGQVPMTPHTGMSKENAKKMVEYILSLKK